MAYDARHGFTVQEATNLQVYNDYKMQKETADGSANEYADWTTTPAKQIIIYIVAAAGDDTSLEVELKINGSYGDKIYIDSLDFPLTIDNLIVDQVRIKGTDDVVGVLSFH